MKRESPEWTRLKQFLVFRAATIDYVLSDYPINYIAVQRELVE